jgi:ribosomal protein L7/L12
MKEPKTKNEDQPWIENYPPLLAWLNKHEAQCRGKARAAMTKQKKAIAAMARVIVSHSELTRSAFTAEEWYEIEKIADGWRKHAVAFARAGKLIEAIKLIRENTNIGLVEAKTMAENMR